MHLSGEVQSAKTIRQPRWALAASGQYKPQTALSERATARSDEDTVVHVAAPSTSVACRQRGQLVTYQANVTSRSSPTKNSTVTTGTSMYSLLIYFQLTLHQLCLGHDIPSAKGSYSSYTEPSA